MDIYKFIICGLAGSIVITWLYISMINDKIATLRDRLNRRETDNPKGFLTMAGLNQRSAKRAEEYRETIIGLKDQMKSLQSELDERKDNNWKFARALHDKTRELSVVRDHFKHLDRVVANLRTDLELANQRNAVQAESIEEFKKHNQGLVHKYNNKSNRVKELESEVIFLEKVRNAQAQTIKEYGEKYGYGEEARKPVDTRISFELSPELKEAISEAKGLFKEVIMPDLATCADVDYDEKGTPTERDCPSCMGRGEVRRPYTEHEKDPCLDCEGLGRLFAVKLSHGTGWYSKSSADNHIQKFEASVKEATDMAMGKTTDGENISSPHDPAKCPDCQRGEKFYNIFRVQDEVVKEEVDCFTCNGTGLPQTDTPPSTKPIKRKRPKSRPLGDEDLQEY